MAKTRRPHQAGWEHTVAAGIDPKARRLRPVGRAYRVEPWTCDHPRPPDAPSSAAVVLAAIRAATQPEGDRSP